MKDIYELLNDIEVDDKEMKEIEVSEIEKERIKKTLRKKIKKHLNMNVTKHVYGRLYSAMSFWPDNFKLKMY